MQEFPISDIFYIFSASKKLFVKTRNLFFAADATMMNQIAKSCDDEMCY